MQTITFLLSALLLSTAAQAEVPVVQLLPECKKDSVQEWRSVIIKDRYSAQPTRVRDIPEVSVMLKAQQQVAADQKYDGIIILDQKQNNLAGQVNRRQQAVLLEMFRFCDDNREFSQTPTPDMVGKILVAKVDELSSVRIGSEMTFQIPVRPEQLYKTVPIDDMSVSLEHGAMGVKPGMTAETVFQLWGSPSVDLTLEKGGRLLGYGRRLWVLLAPEVKAVYTDSEVLSGEGRNLLEFHPEFDDKAWLADGKVAYKAEQSLAAAQLSSFDKSSARVWHRQQRNQKLQLLFDDYNPQSADHIQTKLTGFRLSAVPDYKGPLTLQQPDMTQLLSFLEAVSVRNSLQPRPASLLLPELKLHQIVQRRNVQWWLLTDELQVLASKNVIRRLKISASLLRKGRPSQLPALLKALQIPANKAGLRQSFPDMQDYGDRFELYRDHVELLIEFSSDADDAAISEVELIYRAI